MKGWPGTKRVDSWPIIFEQKDNSPTLNKIISSDVCSGNFKVYMVYPIHVYSVRV